MRMNSELVGLAVAVVVAVAAYVVAGGRYPLPVDLVVVSVIGLGAAVGVRQLVAHARLRAENRRA